MLTYTWAEALGRSNYLQVSAHFVCLYKLVGCCLAVEIPGVETVQPTTSIASEEGQTEAPAPKPVVGIIYPPPEVQSIFLFNVVMCVK